MNQNELMRCLIAIANWAISLCWHPRLGGALADQSQSNYSLKPASCGVARPAWTAPWENNVK
jgi:hypothetical protein